MASNLTPPSDFIFDIKHYQGPVLFNGHDNEAIFFFKSLVMQCKVLASILPTPEVTDCFGLFLNCSQTMLALYSTFVRPYIYQKDASTLANSAKFSDMY